MKTRTKKHVTSSLSRRFTLIELLVVIAIIAILASMLLPALNKARETAKRISCVGQLKSLSTAMLMYNSDYQGFFPPFTPGNGADGVAVYWPNLISPHLGAGDGTHLGYTKYMSKSRSSRIFLCPTHDFDYNAWKNSERYMSYGLNEYLMYRHFGTTADNQPVKDSMLKKPSETLLFGDSIYNNTTGIRYGHYSLAAGRLATRHPGEVQTGTTNVSWCDGHVSSIKVKSYADVLSQWNDLTGRFNIR